MCLLQQNKLTGIESEFGKLVQKILICLISINDMARAFIMNQFPGLFPHFKKQEYLDFMGQAQERSSLENLNRLSIDPSLKNLTLSELIENFDIHMFQKFIMFAGLRFKRKEEVRSVGLRTSKQRLHLRLAASLKRELFVKKSRKAEEVMLSLWSMVKNKVFADFKQKNPQQAQEADLPI